MKDHAESKVLEKATNPSSGALPGVNDLLDYWVDAWQRSILLLDVLRQRGNASAEHNARKAPHVLSFEAELLLDGRSLPRPVNYALVRIVPPKGTAIDQCKRPFIVFDPRAGHGDQKRAFRHRGKARCQGRPASHSGAGARASPSKQSKSGLELRKN